MKSRLSIRSLNRIWFIIFVFLFVAAGCGGGGGGGGALSSSGGTVQVSMASTPGFPSSTSFTASPSAVEEAAKPVSPSFDNVWVEIWKVALLPAKEGEGPDPGGEALSSDGDPDRSGAFVAVELDKVINLQNLPSGQNVAKFLEEIVNVPAGTYGKIRVYYSALWGERIKDETYERVDFHPTANSHFDVHFVGGDLVIPGAPDPERGIHLFEVTIEFVGLKIVENKNKVLMRPQVFAETTEPLYSVMGRAANVTSGAFDIVQNDPAVTPVHVTYSGPAWFFEEDAAEGRRVSVDAENGTAALREDTKVEAIGKFSGEDLSAQEIIITFEDFLQGEVVSGNPSDGWTSSDTLVLYLPPDNVVVPQPSRVSAVYDNNASVDHETLFDTDMVQGVTVKARGYIVHGERIDAFWISWVSGP
jgi:hypothetical protein